MKATYLDHMGSDLMVANAARTSLGKWHDEFNQSDAKLIRYLANHKHNSPFYHPKVQLHFEAPLFVAWQWYRYRIGIRRMDELGADEFDWSQVSRRYVDSEPTFYMPEVWRERAEGVKQGSKATGIANQDDANKEVAIAYLRCEMAYEHLLKVGVAPEQARMVLPMGSMTEWVETGSLFAYAHAVKERLGPTVQDETRQLAQQVAAIIEPLFPAAWPALLEATV